VLLGEDIHEQVLHMIEDTIRDYVRAATSEGFAEDWDLDTLWVGLKQLFPVGVTADELEERSGGGPSMEFLQEELVAEGLAAYQRREDELGEQVLRELERRVILSVLDRRWREHLYEMDYLQEGIGLRGYGQRDPLVEYQREAYDMFGGMMDGIKEESVGFLFNLEVQLDEDQTAADGAVPGAATGGLAAGAESPGLGAGAPGFGNGSAGLGDGSGALGQPVGQPAAPAGQPMGQPMGSGQPTGQPAAAPAGATNGGPSAGAGAGAGRPDGEPTIGIPGEPVPSGAPAAFTTEVGSQQSTAPAPPAPSAPEDERQRVSDVLGQVLGQPNRPTGLQYSAPTVDGEGGVTRSVESGGGGGGRTSGQYGNVSRNAPCPCGSGRKFKRCHGAPDAR
jgi:preprotein translocase subunit SecA